MKVLVTGAAGFIGSSVTDLLIENKHTVIAVDNLLTGKSGNLNPSAKFYEVDICDRERLERVFMFERPEIVFHLAAQVDVTKSIDQPCLDAQSNVIGSLNVLEAGRKYGMRKIVYSNSGGAGSGEPQYLPIDEEHPIEPMSHYGVSKHTVEHYLKIYSGIYGIRFVSLRYANIYGPRQDPYGEGGVVAIFSHKLLNNIRPVIFGDGNQTRDFMYVRDVARVNLLCIDKADDQILNVGTGRETSVNDLFRMMKEATRSDLEPIYAQERKGEIRRSVLGVERMKRILSWQPEIDLNNGLISTIDYFRKSAARG